MEEITIEAPSLPLSPPAKKPKRTTTVRPAASKGECEVCYEPDQKVVKCSNCSYSACHTCVQTYLLSTTKAAHCMSCRCGWTPKFLYATFTKQWIEKVYRDHQKKVSLQREKALLCASMDVIETHNRVEDAKRRITALYVELQHAKDLYHQSNNDIHNARYNTPFETAELKRAHIDGLFDTLRVHMRLYDRIQEDLQFWRHVKQNGVYPDWGGANRPKNVAVRSVTFLCPCPHMDTVGGAVAVAEKCRGIVNSNLKCAVCERYICRSCQEPVAARNDPTHVCNPDTVATIEALRKDTKPCPKCSVPIHKIDGCYQMFCVSCHCVFDWNNLKIDTGTVHNPYALEWQRRNDGGGAGGAGCCNNQNQNHLQHLYQSYEQYLYWLYEKSSLSTHYVRLVPTTEVYYTQVANVHRFTAELIHWLENVAAEPLDMEELRIRYATKQITEAQWANTIFTRERLNERRELVRDVSTTFTQTIADLFGALSLQVAGRYRVSYITLRKDDPARLNPAPNQETIDLSLKFADAYREVAAFCNAAYEGLLLLGAKTCPKIDIEAFKWAVAPV